MIFEVMYCDNGIVKKEKMTHSEYTKLLDNPDVEIIGTPNLTLAWAE